MSLALYLAPEPPSLLSAGTTYPAPMKSKKMRSTVLGRVPLAGKEALAWRSLGCG